MHSFIVQLPEGSQNFDKLQECHIFAFISGGVICTKCLLNANIRGHNFIIFCIIFSDDVPLVNIQMLQRTGHWIEEKNLFLIGKIKIIYIGFSSKPYQSIIF